MIRVFKWKASLDQPRSDTSKDITSVEWVLESGFIRGRLFYFGFPEGIQQVTAGHGAEVLSRPGARKVMKELGEKARNKYESDSSMEIITDLLTVDQIIGEGDVMNKFKNITVIYLQIIPFVR